MSIPIPRPYKFITTDQWWQNRKEKEKARTLGGAPDKMVASEVLTLQQFKTKYPLRSTSVYRVKSARYEIDRLPQCTTVQLSLKVVQGSENTLTSTGSSVFSLSALPSLTPPHLEVDYHDEYSDTSSEYHFDWDNHVAAALPAASSVPVPESSLWHLLPPPRNETPDSVWNLDWPTWLPINIVDALTHLQSSDCTLTATNNNKHTWKHTGMQAFKQIEWWSNRCAALKWCANFDEHPTGLCYSPEENSSAYSSLWNQPFLAEVWSRLLSNNSPSPLLTNQMEWFHLMEQDAYSQRFSRYQPDRFLYVRALLENNQETSCPCDNFVARQLALLETCPSRVDGHAMDYTCMTGCTACSYWWTLRLSHARYHMAEFILKNVDRDIDSCPLELRTQTLWNNLLASLWHKKVMLFAANVFFREHAKHGHTTMPINAQLYGGELVEDDFTVVQSLQDNWENYKHDFNDATNKQAFVDAILLRAVALPDE
eukprot:TRINITY_DN60726_c0_g3_i1.p1 TRINITY_DN60726_c0_g3~~TRINITY_DN60726_c0_g3_i1.p1  ORF type:complete len:495 (+),score=26.01 TRINITY_DN60726_c0_g3_i1:39-1487(+)